MKHILVDFDHCLGCHTCELACGGFHSEAGSVIGAVVAGEKPPVAIKVVQEGAGRYPMQCRHCVDASCVRVCPVHALTHNEVTGTVTCDDDKCLGCMMCAMVCPFGAIHQGTTRKIVKCDLCHDEGTPSCVSACPTKALKFVEVEDFANDRKHDFVVNYQAEEE